VFFFSFLSSCLLWRWDAAKKRFEEKRAAARGERDSEVKERQDAMRQKERATMDMFKQMAKERFG
jgi:hypothetical protein